VRRRLRRRPHTARKHQRDMLRAASGTGPAAQSACVQSPSCLPETCRHRSHALRDSPARDAHPEPIPIARETPMRRACPRANMRTCAQHNRLRRGDRQNKATLSLCSRAALRLCPRPAASGQRTGGGSGSNTGTLVHFLDYPLRKNPRERWCRMHPLVHFLDQGVRRRHPPCRQ
jgi:hypothetical protein